MPRFQITCNYPGKNRFDCIAETFPDAYKLFWEIYCAFPRGKEPLRIFECSELVSPLGQVGYYKNIRLEDFTDEQLGIKPLP